MSVFSLDQDDILFNLVQMNPSLSNQEDRDVLEQFIKFCKNEIDPTRIDCDEQGLIFDKGEVKTPDCLKQLQKSFYENGWFSLGVDESVGGMIASQQLVSAVTSLSIGCNTAWYLYPALSKACMNVLIKLGTEKIRTEIVPNMMSGKWGGTMCLTESGAGSDLSAIKTKASLIEGNFYSVVGEKIFISSGQNDLYENIIHLVLAKTDSAAKNLSLFMVERNNNNVCCEKIEDKMGIHASATCVLNFGSSGVCRGELIGNIGDGLVNMFLMMNEARLLCAMQGEGQGHMAYMKAQAYAGERVQFGSAISEHPDVQRMLLNLRASTRAMRALCQFTAGLLEADDEKLELFTPIAKSYCTDEGFQVCVQALQVFGGYGYCREYGIEQFVRDSKIASIYEGTNGIQAKDFLFRKVLKNKGQNLYDIFNDISITLENAANNKELEVGVEIIIQSKDELKALFDEILNGACTEKELLFHAYPLLNATAHLINSWLLLEHARQSQNLLSKSKITDFSNDYLVSKVVDFKVYVGNYLTRNKGIIQSFNVGRKMRTYGIK